MKDSSITLSFNCPNEGFAAELLEEYSKISNKYMEQMMKDFKEHPERWEAIGESTEATAAPAAQPVAPAAQPVAPAMQYAAPAVQPAAPAMPAMPQTAPVPMPMQGYAAAPVPQGPMPSAAQYAAPTVPQGAPATAHAPAFQQSMVPTSIPPANGVPLEGLPVIRKDQLARALQLFRDASPANLGKIQQALLSFGVQSLDQIPEARYSEFASALRNMGAAVV